MNIAKFNWRPIHKIILLYSLLTLTINAFTPLGNANFITMIWPRLLVLGYLILWPYLVKKSVKWANLLNAVWAIFLLGFFYKETALINQSFKVFDPWFVMADQWLTGTQPSLTFSNHFGRFWFIEAMNFGYFSYYLMIITIPLLLFFKRNEVYEKNLFIIISTFLCYYLLFALFKTVGPQYYFPTPHNTPPQGGFWWSMVTFMQKSGEVPTGAFPSSHIGLTVLFIWISIQYFKQFLWILIPTAILLALSTVYIKAHYLVDIIGGIISSPLIIWLSVKLWYKLNKSTIKQQHD